MAPRTQRDYYSSGDPSRYPLRALRHCVDNFSRLRNVDVAKINGKEDFFRCIGLQMRKLQNRHKTSNGGQSVKKPNVSNSVVLRDCHVVILGSTCTMCGVSFKCETDLNVHVELHHRTDRRVRSTSVKQTQCTGTENELRNIGEENFEDTTTIVSERNFGTKLQKKLRLTLRIGEEVVAKMSVKRKHLMVNTADMCTQTDLADICTQTDLADIYTQTELADPAELPLTKDVCKSIVCGIDPSILSNSPSQCCSPTVCRVDSQNRYFVTSIETNKQPLGEKSASRAENNPSNNLNNSCGTRTNEDRCAAPLTAIPPDLADNDNRSENLDSAKISITQTKNVSILNDSSQFNDNSSRTFSNISGNVSKPSSNDIDDSVVDTCEQVDSRRCNTRIDINGNEIQSDINVCEKERQSRSANNIVQLVMPMIFPIIVPNETTLAAPFKLTIQPASLQREQEPESRRRSSEQRQNRHRNSQDQQDQCAARSQNWQTQQQQQCSEQERHEQQIHRWQSEQQPDNARPFVTKDINDDEVQEVLRIVRGHNINTEINHESPSRIEQAMLVEGAIRDMKRMDVKGRHLPNKDAMEPETKRIRYTKPDAKETSNKMVTCDKDKVQRMMTNAIIDTRVSSEKGNVVKVQSYNAAIATSAEDNTKENLSYNRNVNIPSEVLLDYNINYCDEVFAINNNTEYSIQGSVSRFLLPCSIGMENRGNGPAIIDLVSDTDE